MRSPLCCLATFGVLLLVGVACSDGGSDGSGGAAAGAGSAGGGDAPTSSSSFGDPTAGPTTADVSASGAGGGSTAAGDGGAGEGGSGGAGQGGSPAAGGGGQGGAPDEGPLRCLGEVTWPALRTDPIRIEHTLTASTDEARALGGLSVRVCERDDDACDAPLDESVSTEDGYVDMSATVTPGIGFLGYYEMPAGVANAGADTETPVPENLYFTVVPHTDNVNFELGLVTSEELGGLLYLSTGSPEGMPGRGHVGVTVFDCDHVKVSGILVDVGDAADEATVVSYFAAETGLPDPSLEATDADIDDEGGQRGGIVGIANVLPGRVTITARVAETGDVLGVTEVLVREGAVTTLGMDPTPLE